MRMAMLKSSAPHSPLLRGFLRAFASSRSLLIGLVSVATLAGTGAARAAPIIPPSPADERLTIDLVAAEPDVVTPTGLATDARGRVWVIENNSHMTPKGYRGHTSDRVLVMDDFAPDGRAERSPSSPTA